MKEWEQEVLEQYDIDVTNKKKIRGGVLCETADGNYLLAETKLSEKRLQTIHFLQQHLWEMGFTRIDSFQKNKEEKFTSVLEDESRYLMRKWYVGRECDVKKEGELLQAVKNLANLHRTMKGQIPWEQIETCQHKGEDLLEELIRHNREMKKVRSFMRGKVDKGAFEQLFLQCFDEMFFYADAAVEKLRETSDLNIEKGWIHGDYNYHNLIMLHNGMATTGFEYFEENVQITDFYFFLRKTMEKHQWDTRLGAKMLDLYRENLDISEGDLQYLGILILYPEKYWKAANLYAKSKKTWIPAKNLEKLNLVIGQMKQKQKFLQELLGICL